MSSPTPVKYVYIPNLVGRQMLRIPVLLCEDTFETADAPTIAPTLNLDIPAASVATTSSSRATSPAPSVESVEEEE
ncbi:uncharacterized protein BDR25DRAFT_305399 [Lindgomyces ingoldianus]|uniref:Uncharacterized protein n=1 Tax=Lindgomyces ingoldianus TaxID=673940 RepID=A0ACB6QM12_9PLEO|nr:uncharacterized protein BDR25DRAFT_305399 [Lindgomyces ingoldianus]KAF2467618.1 hypothetical protein BDR25DRAFT_305399 [Lindgomyces ingoldianus]